jgi:glyoxylase-like metal-dependent hydrolase (beta-lactamase superfamily II)
MEELRSQDSLMIEEVFPNIHRIGIPLPKNPLQTVNSYLITGEERFIVIDTGMNREECMREMVSALEELSVDLRKIDFFITHLHADHLGLVGSLATHTSKVYFNEIEASIAIFERSEKHWRDVGSIYRSYGFPEGELRKAMGSHPAHLYGLTRHVDFCILKEGDTIDIGDYSFKCITTPGHSPGHMCLHESNKNVLISGDHILFDITPNITFWPEMGNSLKEYLASLDKVYTLDCDLVLPGHRNIWNNHRKRIAELKEHHQARANQVLSALEEGEKTAYQIAPYITWDMDYGSWELFPPVQRWFATGETIAHIKYLEENKMIQRRTKGHKVVFSLA